jgi:hypothetical protein
VRELYGDIFHDDGGMWLRDAYRVHRKADKWIVEGIVIDGNSDTAEACFWAVEIVDDAGASVRHLLPGPPHLKFNT